MATPARGARVLSTCLGHMLVTRELGTIVTFSWGAVRGHSPFPGENTGIALSLSIWVGCLARGRAVGALGDRNGWFAVLYLYDAVL